MRTGELIDLLAGDEYAKAAWRTNHEARRRQKAVQTTRLPVPKPRTTLARRIAAPWWRLARRLMPGPRRPRIQRVRT